MHGLLFGTAGIPLSARARTTESGIARVSELGLGCLEVQFVQGVKMADKVALSVGKTARTRGVVLTAHAPYFINLNARESAKVGASQDRLLQTARVAEKFEAFGIVFHPGFYLGDSPDKAYSSIKTHLEEVRTRLRDEDNAVILRPEVMGKISQFGSLEETIALSAEIAGVAPCLDFSHWHARTGKANSYKEFVTVLDQVEEKLGRQALDNMHIHVSGVAYGPRGEIRHLTLDESDFQYTELLKALKERRVQGVVICESPNLEEDALLLQQTYLDMLL